MYHPSCQKQRQRFNEEQSKTSVSTVNAAPKVLSCTMLRPKFASRQCNANARIQTGSPETKEKSDLARREKMLQRQVEEKSKVVKVRTVVVVKGTKHGPCGQSVGEDHQ